MNNCCKYLRIRSKHYKKYFYCVKAKRMIDIDSCKNCIFKEYKICKPIKVTRKKENDISIFNENQYFQINEEKNNGIYKTTLYKGSMVKIIGYEKHHIFGGKNRSNSDHYGLFLWIPKEIHKLITENPNLNKPLEKLAQTEFKKKYPKLNFKKIFYTNSL